MITRESDYALRAVLYLGKPENAGKSVSTLELAEQMEIPYRFLRKIVNRLAKADIIESQRGKSGGVRLTKKSEELSVSDVLNALDDRSMTLNRCLLEDGEACTRNGGCSIHRELKELQVMIDSRLQSIKFSDLSG